MKTSKHVAALRPGVDPFEERQSSENTLIIRALGSEFRFTASDSRLLELAAHAYEGLPKQTGSSRARFYIDLRLGLERPPKSRRHARRAPAPMRLHSGAGLLSGSIDADNFVVVAPAERKGWVAVSEAMLEFPYHVRYELIGFAVYTLAARAKRLAP